jgi:eukaryotic-like serine/threonine-protein kinase
MAENRCSSCGAQLPAHAPGGHCPHCLLLQGLDDNAPGPDRDPNGDTLNGPPGPGSVLETISATIGHVPRVMLRDTAFGEEPSPIVRPLHETDPTLRYRIDGEITRGGMGAILKARDPDIGRDVAIKVLREDLHDNGDLVRRFVEEAQIGGQLQHPGVVPIYELGTFADKRPFFSMKLVKGQTLADLLADRPTPAHDLPRFLSIFASIAQTMAYSHTRGVIHRDLKPSNVMVGSFGEVQVMDWGLAKVMPRGGVADDAKAGKETPPETLIATARSGSDRELSHAGSVLGTPSYMSPEQARGENDLINERADVFALGSILVEILTGSPAFTGRGSSEILRKASRGDTAEAVARLDGCGAEAELVSLARDCLAVEPEDRPRDAKVVSDRITAYLAGVQERVQAAQRERAVAVARAVEERRRRKVQLALAAAVLALTTLGGLSTTYYLHQRQAQAAATDRVVGQAETLRNQARANPEELARWEVALAAVKQAEAAGDASAAPRLFSLRTEVQTGRDSAERDKTLLGRLVDIRSAEADDPDGSDTDAAYAEAFREAKIDLASLPPAEAGSRIKARPASVATALAVALDDWAAIRRGKRKDPAKAAQLSDAARVADPDPWRNDLRTSLDQPEKAARLTRLQTLAKKAKYDELGPISLHLLGTGLSEAGDSIQAESVLRAAQQRHSRDGWVNYALGNVLEKLSRRDEAIRFYTAARSLRPETAHELAHALKSRGDSDEAIAVFRDLKELRPGIARHLGCLGFALADKGRSREADEAFESAVAAARKAIGKKPDDARAYSILGLVLGGGKHEYAAGETQLRTAIRLKPDDAVAHTNLGLALAGQGKLDLAVDAYREAIRLKPDDFTPHYNLGLALAGQGKLDLAVAAHREAIRLKPDDAGPHYGLGNALRAQRKLDLAVAEYREAIRLKPNDSAAHHDLALALHDQGKLDLAVAEYRGTIRLKPDDAEIHSNMGAALRDQGKLDLAVAAHHEAIRLKPDLAGAHSNLGIALYMQGKFDLAVAEFREAIRLKPDSAEAHSNLGNAMRDQGKLDAAVAEYREAIRFNPDYSVAHNNLGNAMRDQGKLDAAVAEYREAIRLRPDDPGAHTNLGIALKEQGNLDAAVAEYREAIRLKPDSAEAHTNLGIALKEQGNLNAAVAEYREAIRIKPDNAAAHYNLGITLARQGKLDEAVAEYREAIRLKPDHAEAHCNLGHLLHGQGDYAGSLEMLRRGHELGTKRSGWPYPSAQWVAQAERFAALAERLPAILKGEDHPKDVAERLVLAQMCYDTKRHSAAARFWAEALEADPNLADDRRASHRYNAACAAALAASGETKDVPAPDAAAQAKLRRQSLLWLKAEQAAWGKLLESGPAQARIAVARFMNHWKEDKDLAGIRQAEALAKLPEAEQKEWQALWAEVEALLKRAQGQTPATP